jgi:hypothetical protein
MINLTVLVDNNSLMAINMKDILKMDIKMGKERLLGLMVCHIQEILN